MRLCCALVFPEEEKNNKSSGTGQIRFQTAFLSKEHTLSFSFARRTTTKTQTRAFRFISRKNDALVVLPSPERARSRRRRRPPRSRDRCPSFFVRRPLLYFEMSRRIRRLSDDFPTTRSFARRGEKNEKGERERVSQCGSAVARRQSLFVGCCCQSRREERRLIKVTKTESLVLLGREEIWRKKMSIERRTNHK